MRKNKQNQRQSSDAAARESTMAGRQPERAAGRPIELQRAMQIARLLVAVGCCLLLPSYTAAFPSSVTHVHEQPAKPTTDY